MPLKACFRCSNMLMFAVVLILCVWRLDGKLRCHKNCNGHGYCTDYDNFCVCDVGYTGVDCSMKTCAYDFAYADKAYSMDEAHSLAECSNQGLCNRKSGKCECFSGFTGIACQRTKCGGTPECNGRGHCLTMGELYQQVTSTTRGIVKQDYTNWDSNHTTLCSCQIGFAGASCEYQLCPKGDDPFTKHTGYRTIVLTAGNVDGLDKLSGNFLFSFNGESFLFPPQAADFTLADCKASFEALANVKQVKCEYLEQNNRRTKYKVQLIKFPVYPEENNIFFHGGNPSLESFSCNTEQIIGGSAPRMECFITELDTDKTYPEYAPCSNRGLCDFETGVCNCLPDMENSNCDTFRGATILSSRAIASDVLHLEVSNPDFTDTVIDIDSNFQGTKVFNTISARDFSNEKFSLNGYGDVKMNYGGLFIGGNGSLNLGGETIRTSGLTVTGGVSVFAGGLVVNALVNVTNFGLFVQSDGFSIYDGVDMENSPFTVTGGATVSGGLYVNNSGVIVSAGGGTVLLGGMTVTGGATLNSGGLTVRKRGVTIVSGGLFVNGGMTLRGLKGSINSPDGITVNSGGFGVTGGLTVFNLGLNTASLTVASDGLVTKITMFNGGLRVSGGVTIEASGLLITGGITVNDNGVILSDRLLLTGGLTIHNDGMLATGGLTINNQGLYSDAGITLLSGSLSINPSSTVTIGSSGLRITGGLSVQNIGLSATAGITVYNGGISVTSGLSIQRDGFRMTGGLSVVNNGVIITGGITAFDAGVISPTAITIDATGIGITGGLSVQSAGVLVTNGITIFSGGLHVTSGLTIVSSGLLSSDLVEVLADGVQITGGLSLYSVGLKVTTGVTITDIGLRVSGGGVTIQDAGFEINGGLSIQNIGLRVTGGISILSDSLRVSNGVTVYDSGLTTNDGLTVNTGSLQVRGGLTLLDSHMYVANRLTSANDMIITSGLTIETSGVRLNRYLSISNDGLSVTGGISIYTLGLNTFSLDSHDVGVRVSDAGMSINSGGALVVTGGLTAFNQGIKIPSLTRVYDNGLEVVSGGMTVLSSGLIVSGGLSITGQGVRLRSLSIDADGLYVTGTLTVSNTGFTTDAIVEIPNRVRVRGGATVLSGGANAPGLTISNNGLRVTGGLSTYSSIRVTNGLTISSDGLVVTGGLTVPSVEVITGINPAVKVRQDGVLLLAGSPLEVRSDGIFIRDDLRVNGAIYLQFDYTVYSDIRLKGDIVQLPNPLQKIRSIRGVTYNWAQDVQKRNKDLQHVSEIESNTDADAVLRYVVKDKKGYDNSIDTPAAATADDDGEEAQLVESVATESVASPRDKASELVRYVGVIAQEVQSVLPEIVGETKEGLLGVQYGVLVALIIEAIRGIDLRTRNSRCDGSTLDSENGSLPCLISLVSQAMWHCQCANTRSNIQPNSSDDNASEALRNRVGALLSRVERLQQDEVELIDLFESVALHKGLQLKS